MYVLKELQQINQAFYWLSECVKCQHTYLCAYANHISGLYFAKVKCKVSKVFMRMSHGTVFILVSYNNALKVLYVAGYSRIKQ